MRITNRKSVVLFLSGFLMFFGSLAQAGVVNIDNDTLQSMLDQGATIIDVRREDEWRDTGVIDSSHLLTFFDAQGNYDAESWIRDLESIVSSDEPVILICRSGNRTKTISHWLSEKQGYARVFNVTDGILSWKAQNGGTVAP